MRRKLIEDTKLNAFLIFKFIVRENTLEWLVIDFSLDPTVLPVTLFRGCLVCSDNIGLTFKNPISLRLNALLHLEKHVNEEHFEHLQAMIDKVR